MIKTIPEFPDYGVSEDGGLWRMTKTRNVSAQIPHRVVTPTMGNGYPGYVFAKDGKRYTRMLHRLVAMAFCDGYKEGLHVRHLNGNSMDARASNLAWGTRKENCQDRTRLGEHRFGEAHEWSKITERQATIVKLLLYYGFNSRNSAHIAGVPHSTARNIQNKQCWKHISLEEFL